MIASADESDRQLPANIQRVISDSIFHGEYVSVVITDENDDIVMVSPSAERLFKYPPDALLDMPLNSIIAEELREEAQAVIKRAHAGEMQEVSEAAALCKDGSVVPVSILIAPILSDENVVGLCALYRNLASQWEAHERERRNEAYIKAVIGHLPVILFTLDRDGVFTLSEGQALKSLGAGFKGSVGQSIYEAHPSAKTLHLGFETALQGESIVTTAEYAQGAFQTVYSPLTDGEGRIKGVVGLAHDVSEMLAAQHRLEHMAHHDELTDLPNRTLFLDRVNEAIRRSRHSKRRFAVFFVDVDRFKTINDSLGHAAGDRVLCAVATRFSDVLRETDTVARLGGDEFAVLIEQVRDSYSITVTAQKLLDSLAQPIVGEDVPLNASASIGISLYPDDGSGADELLRKADMAMYEAKSVRNSYQFFSTEMSQRTYESLRLTSDMRAALKRNEFELYYQPVINLNSNTITGFEALIRWNHPERGLLMPGEFIPLAEDTGLIKPLGEWVIKAACCQSRKWVDRGYTDVRTAVNLSAKQFSDVSFIERAGRIVKQANLPPDQLLFELTESTLFPYPDKARALLEQFSAMGISLAIDDFGTGYSSLSYLRDFPVDYLKIDRSFVENLPTDQSACAMANTIIAMAQNLNMKVVAEGVEVAAQLDFLRLSRCEAAQGFYFSKPVPVSQADELLSAGGMPVA